jgi:hypothetical protein
LIRRSTKDPSRHGDEPRASRLPRLTPQKSDEPVSLSLRDIVPPPPPQETEEPADNGLVVSDAEARPVPWLGDPQAELDDQRAARRAQVRRDRLAHAAEVSAAEDRASAVRAAELRAAEVRAAEERAAQARAAEQRAADVRAAQERAARVRAEQARLAAAAAQQAKVREAPEPETDPTQLQEQLKAQMQAQVRAAQAELAEKQAAEARAAVERAAQARAAEQRAADVRAAAEREAQARAAAVREAAEREAADAAARAAAAPEALVLSAAEPASSPLYQQLEAFGFRVRVLREPPQLPAPWPFVAVFVDRALDMPGGGDAIDLCNHVRETSRLPGERKPVLMLVAEQLSSTDRVRAGLAGCNELIVGEITRGAVAGALDRRGILLPSDARRV